VLQCLVINNYQVLLYNSVGLYGSLPLLLYAVWDSWAAFMNWVNAMILDKVGRIPVMVVGQVQSFSFYCSIRYTHAVQIGCAISVAGFTGCVAAYGGTDNKVGNGFGVFFLYLCMFPSCYGTPNPCD
jgi:hypothetical protein